MPSSLATCQKATFTHVMLYIFNKIKTYFEIYFGRLNKTDFRNLNNSQKFEGIS